MRISLWVFLSLFYCFCPFLQPKVRIIIFGNSISLIFTVWSFPYLLILCLSSAAESYKLPLWLSVLHLSLLDVKLLIQRWCQGHLRFWHFPWEFPLRILGNFSDLWPDTNVLVMFYLILTTVPGNHVLMGIIWIFNLMSVPEKRAFKTEEILNSIRFNAIIILPYLFFLLIFERDQRSDLFIVFVSERELLCSMC